MIPLLILLTGGLAVTVAEELDLDDIFNQTESPRWRNQSNFTTLACGPPVWNADAIVNTIVYTTIFCVSVMGNCLVIVTIINNRSMRTVTNMFLLNLAISDLILTVFCIPSTLIGPILFRCFLFGPVMCKVFTYVQVVSVTACAHTLVVIALERYFAICRPLQSRRWQTKSHSIKMIATVWIVALTTNSHYLFVAQLFTLENKVANCRTVWPDNWGWNVSLGGIVYMDISLFVLPLLIMTFLYGLVIQTLYTGMQLEKLGNERQSLNGEESLAPSVVHPSSNGHLQPDGGGMFRRLSDTIMQQRGRLEDPSRKRTALPVPNNRPLGRGTALRSTHTERNLIAKKRVIKMLAAIVIEFLVCWMPFYIFRTLYEFNVIVMTGPIYRVYSGLLILAFVSSCTNPITYCFMNKKFRQAFLLIFGCQQCTKPSESTILCRLADRSRLPSVVIGTVGDRMSRVNQGCAEQSFNQTLLATTDYAGGNPENSLLDIPLPTRKKAIMANDSPLNIATLL